MGVAGAVIGAGALAATASVAGSAISSSAAKSAASTQAAAANNAAQLQMNEFNQTQANVAPFTALGTSATGTLGYELGLPGYANPGGTAPGSAGSLTAPFTPTMASLAATPGYQFVLGQGLQATQNSYAAQGLGTSGSAQKGAANYAESLAGNTYQQQFQNYLSQNLQISNMLNNQTTMGTNAALGVGSQGVTSTANAGANLTSAGAASAAGTVGAANALTSGLSGLTSAGSNTSLLLALNNAGMFGPSPVGSANSNALLPQSIAANGYGYM